MGSNEYKVAHILVDKEDEAKAIIADLNSGGDFAKIAKDKSKDPGSKENGGDLDWGPSARYVKPFADAVTTQPKGKISAAPVKTDFGYHDHPRGRRAPAQGARVHRGEGAVPPARAAADDPEDGHGPALEGEGRGALARDRAPRA
jgi:hypothetical protein